MNIPYLRNSYRPTVGVFDHPDGGSYISFGIVPAPDAGREIKDICPSMEYVLKLVQILNLAQVAIDDFFPFIEAYVECVER